jgi:hypothetical protein
MLNYLNISSKGPSSGVTSQGRENYMSFDTDGLFIWKPDWSAYKTV